MSRFISDEEKLNRIREWDNCSKEEREILVKKYKYKNYVAMTNAISVMKRMLNTGKIIRALSKEEKLNRIREWEKCCSHEEKQKFTEKYGFPSVTASSNNVSFYRRAFNPPKKRKYSIGSTSDERTKFVNKWSNLDYDERKKLAIDINIPYDRIITLVAGHRRATNTVIASRVHRTDEEKINLIEKWESMTNYEKHELAEQMGLSFEAVKKKVSIYRSQMNMPRKEFNEDEKLNRIHEWESIDKSLRSNFVKKYDYKNVESAAASIRFYKKQLNL